MEEGEFYELAGGVVEELVRGAGCGAKLILATTKGDIVRQCAWMGEEIERREDPSYRKPSSAEHAQGPYPEHGTLSVPTLGAALAQLARDRGVVPGYVVSTACTSGLVALIEAAMQVANGEAERVMAVGADVAGEFVRDGFAALKAVSPTVCRPFDLHRNGLMLGSGAAGCSLSRSADAEVVVSGWGVSNDAVHMTAPDRNAGGLIRAIRQALERAELEPREIDVVFAHGTGTPFNDAMEAVAIERVFLDGGASPAVTAVKGLIGHTLGAAGLIEAVLGVEMIRREMILPITHLQVPEQEGFDFVREVRRCEIRHLLKIGSGFGGMNAAVVLSRPHGGERILPRAARGGGRRWAGVVAASGGSNGASSGEVAERAMGSLMEQVPAEKRAEVGLVIGTTLGCLETDREFERSRREAGGRYASPAAFSRSLPSTVAAELALKFGMKGPSLVVSAGDTSTAVALRRAVRWMGEFGSEYCVAGGVEWVGEGVGVPTGKRVVLFLLGRGEGGVGRLEVEAEGMCDLDAVADRSLVAFADAVEGRREVAAGGVRVKWS